MLPIKIDPEFQNLIPPLTADEYAGLEREVRQKGCLDPLKTWDGVLVDGHNRYKICQKYQINFHIVSLDFATRQDAYNWIINNQLSRRNVTPEQASYLRGKRYLAEKKEQGGTGANQFIKQTGQNVQSALTAQRLADELHVNEKTIRRDAQFAAAVDNVAKTLGVETQKDILHRELQISRKDITTLASLAETSPESARTIIQRIKSTKEKPTNVIRDIQRESIRTNLESVETKDAKIIQGVYDVIVIDPPWPMVKIERDERPNQSEFEYPTMTIAEIAELKIPAADACHVWLWTTQKFLPDAFYLLKKWDFAYICTFVWHKPGGFQPYGLPQFNCEFALYARRGSPPFLDTKAFFTCFEAPRGAHSEKPQAFYDVLTRVTAGRRLDMFNRRVIPGFDGWGKESTCNNN